MAKDQLRALCGVMLRQPRLVQSRLGAAKLNTRCLGSPILREPFTGTLTLSLFSLKVIM